MNETEYEQRVQALEELTASINKRVDDCKKKKKPKLKTLNNIKKDIIKAKAESDELMNDLEVEDFLINGAGRTRDVEYN